MSHQKMGIISSHQKTGIISSHQKTVAILLVVIALMLSACSNTSGTSVGVNRASSEEVVSGTFNADKPTIVVQTFNGTIDVSVASGTAIKVDVTKRGSGDTTDEAKADLKNIQVTMNQEGSTVNVSAKRTDRNNVGNSGASVKISVPSGAILDLQTSNGKVTVSGNVSDVSVQNSNGPVEVNGATGALDLEASNANVTSNGGGDKLKLVTSNGTIDATTTADVQVDASNSNGIIRFNGPLATKGKNSLRSSNGVVAVTLPAKASFTVNATTSNGKIISDFAVTGDNKTDQQLKGTVGDDPQTTLTLNTSNGNIEIHKGK